MKREMLLKIKKTETLVKKIYYKQAAKVCKEDKTVAFNLRLIKDHFKKYSWPLCHEQYQLMMGVKNTNLFNAILEKAGMTIYYETNKLKFLFKPKKRKP